jgi:G3E family GTPase
MRHDSRRFPFLPQATDRGRLPVALLSGFLGSGKTTLVNALLIDHGADQTAVMANGCLCCNLAGDMEDAVMRLFTRRADGEVPRFERLIVEPSGLADPAPIAQAILRNPMMARSLRLASIVTTVDALFASAQLARHPETRKQIALADRLVLTKPDLVDPAGLDSVRSAVAGINALAPVLIAERGAVDAALLFPADFFHGDAVAERRSLLMAEDVDADHTARLASVSLTAQAPLRWQAFDSWLRGIRVGHAEQLLRMKGMLDIAGVDGPVVVQGVHHVIDTPVMRDAWPGGHRSSRLVLIADPGTIAAARASWAAALTGMLATP